MLTKRQNMLEAIHNGNPDRYVNQYEALKMVRMNPNLEKVREKLKKGGEPAVDGWGVWRTWPEGQPGPFPLHDAEHLLLPDITKWREVIKAPDLTTNDAEWEDVIAWAESIDRNEYFVTAYVSPGIFSELTHFQGMDNALVNYILEPEACKDLLAYLVEDELVQAENLCKYMKPDALFHHDDFGSFGSTFISPATFEEFILPCYKEIYGYYKDHGVEVVVHHSDSYGRTLVPYMHEMGVDVWQGCMSSNNIPECVEEYKDIMAFMGGIDNAFVDFPDSTPEIVERETRRAVSEVGTPVGFIPCITQGNEGSYYPGVFDTITETIKKINQEQFGIPVEDQ